MPNLNVTQELNSKLYMKKVNPIQDKPIMVVIQKHGPGKSLDVTAPLMSLNKTHS